MSLILESLRRRKDPLAGRPVAPCPLVDPATGAVAPPADASDGPGAHVFIYVLFLIIFAVCGWVLLEWLLASHYNLHLP